MEAAASLGTPEARLKVSQRLKLHLPLPSPSRLLLPARVFQRIVPSLVHDLPERPTSCFGTFLLRLKPVAPTLVLLRHDRAFR